jgi:hypothetical protein
MQRRRPRPGAARETSKFVYTSGPGGRLSSKKSVDVVEDHCSQSVTHCSNRERV